MLQAFQLSFQGFRFLPQAAFLAQNYLARVQAAGYAALDEKIRTLGGGDQADEAMVNSEMSAVSSLNSDYEWNALLRRENDGGSRRIAVTVTVSWAGRPGGPEIEEKEAVGYVAAP